MSTDKVCIHLCPLYSSRILKKMARKLSNVFCGISVRLVVLRCEAISDFAKTRGLSIIFKVASVNKILAFLWRQKGSPRFFREIQPVHTAEYAAMSFLLSDWLYSGFMECDNTLNNIKGLFTWRWGTPACLYIQCLILKLKFDHVYMIGGVTRRMLPHLPGVPHLHVNRP